MSEVTLVLFQTGEGYDWQEFTYKAFSSKEKAEVYVGVMNHNLKLDKAHIETCGHLKIDILIWLSKKYGVGIDYTGGKFVVGQTITIE